ncbi:hypothetical protein ACSDQ9_13340 [Aestuariimicrobium soli]|uniref:hypothetical protein n=1 Tax=Aestuariimicrobium soli TaxID=2035834 RepID=UPI003EBF3569
MTTWVPLVVGAAIAVFSGVASYLTALHMSSRAARQELQATKRTAYAKALGDIDAGYDVLANAKGPLSPVEEQTLSAMERVFGSAPRLSEEEAARFRIEARRRMAEAMAQVLVLGRGPLREALYEVEPMTRADWLDEGRDFLAQRMVQDLAAGERLGVAGWWARRRLVKLAQLEKAQETMIVKP